jgi:hypothetical protein
LIPPIDKRLFFLRPEPRRWTLRRTVHHLGFGQSNGFENSQRDVDDVVKLGAQFTVTEHAPVRHAYSHADLGATELPAAVLRCTQSPPLEL